MRYKNLEHVTTYNYDIQNIITVLIQRNTNEYLTTLRNQTSRGGSLIPRDSFYPWLSDALLRSGEKQCKMINTAFM